MFFLTASFTANLWFQPEVQLLNGSGTFNHSRNKKEDNAIQHLRNDTILCWHNSSDR